MPTSLEPNVAFRHRLENPAPKRAPPQAQTTRHSRHLEKSVHPLQLRPSVNVRSRRPAEDCHDHLMHTEAHDDTRREELARWRRNRLFPDLMAQQHRGKLPSSNRRLGVKRKPVLGDAKQIPMTMLRRYSAIVSTRTRWLGPKAHGRGDAAKTSYEIAAKSLHMKTMQVHKGGSGKRAGGLAGVQEHGALH